MIIAIDGFSSTGKSSLAKEVAKQLNYNHIDSGAMYRAITLYAIKNQLFNEENIDTRTLQKSLNQINIEFQLINKKNFTFLNGNNIEQEIRELDVSRKVSQIAKLPFVRNFLVDMQRKIGEKGKIVMDGRDIGTVVFPNANYKFFLEAEAEVRAERRFKELKESGKNILLQEVVENINRRDMIDVNRELSPLKKAIDAIVIDNTFLTREETIEMVLKHIEIP